MTSQFEVWTNIVLISVVIIVCKTVVAGVHSDAG